MSRAANAAIQAAFDAAFAALHEAQQTAIGQLTLGHLIDELEAIPAHYGCVWSTGHEFGLDPIEWEHSDAWTAHGWHQPATSSARSATAHPSCYRGFYSDLTFNCAKGFERSTVEHVLDLARAADGVVMQGYKGGGYLMTRTTFVWGAGTSHSETGEWDDQQGYNEFVGVSVDHEAELAILLATTPIGA